MKIFLNLELLTPYRSGKPFAGVRTIKWRAEQILSKRERTTEQIDSAATTIRRVIDDFKEERVREEFDAYVCKLYERGGWELDFLEDCGGDRHPTLAEIRALLENWPSWADDKPDAPVAEDFDDLESLQEVLDSDYWYDDIPDFPSASVPECYAVLSLMKLEEAVSLLFIPEKRTPHGILISPGPCPWTTQAAIAAGNLIVEAMDILCQAEHRLYAEQMEAIRKTANRRFEEQVLNERAEKERIERSEKACALAQIRWTEDADKREQAKALIEHYFGLWDKDRSLYKNQGEFARDLEEKIETELGRNKHQKLLYSSSTIEVTLIPLVRKKFRSQ